MLTTIANDRARDDDTRVAAMSKLATHLGAAEATLLFDRLVRDPSPAVRVEALRLLRDIDTPEVWAARVEMFVDDRSADARGGLAAELGSWHAEIDRWLPVLGPLLADIDPLVQIEAAISLSRSAKHWSMALGVFEAALEREPDDEDEPHSAIFWALAESKVVPIEVARNLAGAWRKQFADHAAIDRIFDGVPAPRAKKSASRAQSKPSSRSPDPKRGGTKPRAKTRPNSSAASSAAKRKPKR
jgi:hypothetical protein